MTRQPFVDLLGQKFGLLSVIALGEKDRFCKTRWVCLCDCGKERLILSETLRRGQSISCGCVRRKPTAPRFHGESKTRLYRTWTAMKRRCRTPSDNNYRKYGARGISYCNEWEQYLPFKKWAMENGYSSSLTIDRINNDGNYCPENCRWITNAEQQNNKRTNHIITHDGKSMTIADWSREKGVAYKRLYQRLRLEHFSGSCLDKY